MSDEDVFDKIPTVMGRPRKELKWEQVEKLCSMFCTARDIAGFFEISVATLERRIKETFKCTFAELYESFSSVGRVSIRRKQFTMAVDEGNTKMLELLGQQELGQSRKVTQKLSTDDDKLIINFVKKDEPST